VNLLVEVKVYLQLNLSPKVQLFGNIMMKIIVYIKIVLFLQKDLDRYCGNNISAIQSYMSHVYCNGNAVMYYELDDGKYFNHDREKFNVKKTYSKKFEQGKESWIAIRDINENEELFINYAFDGIIDDPPWFIDLSKKYNVPIGVEFENWSNEHESNSNNNDDQNYGLSLLVKDEKLQQIEQI